MRPADRALAARDPSLPGLRAVLDPDELGARIRAGWVASAPPPERVQVTYLRYKPGSHLVAAVRSERDGRRRTDLLLTAGAGAQVKRTKLLGYAARHGIGTLAADDDLLLLPLAADRHLPGLRRLERRIGWLDPALRGAALEVLAYKPHRRLVVRVEVDGRPVAAAKVHDADRIDGAIAALRWAGSDAARELSLPRLLAADRGAGLVLTSWLPGRSLDEQSPERRRATLRGLGKLLGRLHRRDAGALPAHLPGDDRATVRAIAQLRPDLGREVADLLRASPPAPVTGPVHGDLSADQVVHGHGGVGLIDLDRTGRGSAAEDLASWVAAAMLADPAADGALPAALLEGYHGVDGPAALEDVAAQVPRALLRRATDPFRHRAPGWDETLGRLVQAAAHPRDVQEPA